MTRTLILASLLGATVACAPAEVDMPFDGDGDGLMDDVEANYGTLPDNPDSDDDGWLDGEEIDGFTDPTDPADHPYTGGWGIGACRNDVAGETVAVGSVAPNFEGVDQFGDTVRLHDFCHNAVLIVTGSEWCGPCQSYRSTMASYWADYHERGFMIIDLLLETADGSAIDQEALVRWADGHEYAVLDDTNGPISHQGYVNGGIPAISLIAPGGEIVILDGSPSASDIEAILPW